MPTLIKNAIAISMCTPGKDSQTRIQGRNIFKYTHVHTVGTGSPNQHAGQKDVHKHTNVHTVHKASIQGRKMFTNTQYVHRVNKPAYREERCSQTHNMFTELTNQHTGKKDVHKHTIYGHRVNKPAYREERCSQTHNMFTELTNKHTGKKDVHKHTICSQS